MIMKISLNKPLTHLLKTKYLCRDIFFLLIGRKHQATIKQRKCLCCSSFSGTSVCLSLQVHHICNQGNFFFISFSFNYLFSWDNANFINTDMLSISVNVPDLAQLLNFSHSPKAGSSTTQTQKTLKACNNEIIQWTTAKQNTDRHNSDKADADKQDKTDHFFNPQL